MPKIALRADDELFAVVSIVNKADNTTITVDDIDISENIKIGSLFDSPTRVGCEEGKTKEITIGAGGDISKYTVIAEQGDDINHPDIFIQDVDDNLFNVDQTPLFSLLSPLQQEWVSR